LNGGPGEIARGLSLKITLYITNLANKNAVIYTNEGNFDLRQKVNEPRVFGVRLSYRFGKLSGNSEY
jgi:outer membrane receptor protein involved in Fe transport